MLERELKNAIQALGLSRRCVCIHSSLRSFGHVEGGPDKIIQAFVEADCTILVPTFSNQFRIAPPPDLRPARNGCDYQGEWTNRSEPAVAIYSSATNAIDRDMGAIPAAVVNTPGRVRGNHAFNSFTAIGGHAAAVAGTQSALDVFAPLKALVAGNGSVVLMGVGLNRLTLIHLAEAMAGRQLFRRWARGPDGKAIMFATGGCSSGFWKLENVLAPVMHKMCVGQSNWIILPAFDALNAAIAAIRLDPAITHCGRPDCERCRDAVLGGPIIS